MKYVITHKFKNYINKELAKRFLIKKFLKSIDNVKRIYSAEILFGLDGEDFRNDMYSGIVKYDTE